MAYIDGFRHDYENSWRIPTSLIQPYEPQHISYFDLWTDSFCYNLYFPSVNVKKKWNQQHDMSFMQHIEIYLNFTINMWKSSNAYKQDVNNRWNRWSENQSISRWQSMPINRLISIIDEQSMPKFFVIIDFIDYQFSSIINANRSVNWHRLSSIGFHFLSALFSVKISKNTVSLCILMMKLR